MDYGIKAAGSRRKTALLWCYIRPHTPRTAGTGLLAAVAAAICYLPWTTNCEAPPPVRVSGTTTRSTLFLVSCFWGCPKPRAARTACTAAGFGVQIRLDLERAFSAHRPPLFAVGNNHVAHCAACGQCCGARRVCFRTIHCAGFCSCCGSPHTLSLAILGSLSSSAATRS